MHRIALITALLLGAGALALTAAGPSPARALTNCTVSDFSLDGEESSLIALINGYRTRHGLVALTVAPALNRTATWMVTDLSARSTFSHPDSLGRPFYVRTKDCGYPNPGGENIGAGTVRDTGGSAFDQFHNSPEHDSIMLAPEFREIGVARLHGGPYGWYWAVEFGLGDANAQAAAPAPAPAATAPPAAPAPVVAAAPAPPPPAPSVPALKDGANQVTWAAEDTPTADAVRDLGVPVVVVYGYDPSSNGWLHYSPGAPIYLQTLPSLHKGEQYWVLVGQ